MNFKKATIIGPNAPVYFNMALVESVYVNDAGESTIQFPGGRTFTVHESPEELLSHAGSKKMSASNPTEFKID